MAKGKASERDLLRIYRRRKDWTFQTFVAAVNKETRSTYSRMEGFKLLQKLRNQQATDAKQSGPGSNAWMDQIAKAIKGK